MRATVIMTIDVEYDDPTQVSDVVSVVAGEVRCRVVRNGARVSAVHATMLQGDDPVASLRRAAAEAQAVTS